MYKLEFNDTLAVLFLGHPVYSKEDGVEVVYMAISGLHEGLCENIQVFNTTNTQLWRLDGAESVTSVNFQDLLNKDLYTKEPLKPYHP